MNEIISKWILNRIDYVVDMTPEIFRVKTANGHLISQLLHDYKIITTEDLNLLKKTDHVSDCNDNFKLINPWLNNLRLNLSEEDIYDIVHGIGSTSLDLFYRMFLQLKSKFDDVTGEDLINVKLGKRLHRFCLKPCDALSLHKNGLCESLLKLQINKKSYEKYRSSIPTEELNDLDTRTYQELIDLQNEARNMPDFVPDPKKVKQIINNLRVKSKLRQKNKKLEHNLIHKGDNKKIKSEDENLLEQSSKLSKTTIEKQYKTENETLNKDFVDALVLKDNTLNQQKLLYYLERERVQQLHKKIWNENIKSKQQTNSQLCNEALKDIVEISMEISYYKKRYKQEPNECQMEDLKKQFLLGGLKFDLCAPELDKEINYCDDIPEEIVTRDINRQSKIEEEFENYQNHRGTWEAKNLENFSSDLIEKISCGLNVLGYIVHRALEHKYPIVSLWEKAHFPDVSTRVCINGITDTSILPNLRHLLASREIKIIELNEAVDYCLKAYKQESKRELEEEENVSLTKEPIKKGAKLKKDKLSSKKVSVTPLQTENKQVQTPLKFPCEEILYNYEAQLGKTAQELLDQGKPIGDFLLTDMFIAYLSSIPDLKGWALVNYPTNFEQAVIIEEALTGVKLMDPITKLKYERSLMELTGQNGGDKDVCSLYGDFDIKRSSKLLNNPITPEPVQVYDTALTAFIRLKQISKDDSNSFGLLNDNLDSLDKFYFDVGANYPLYYEELDGRTVTQLARLIIGDCSLPLKSCSELFGASNTIKKTGDKLKKSQPKFAKADATNQSGNKVTIANNAKDKRGKLKSFEDKCVQVPSEDEEECELSSVTLALSEPGQPGWEYSRSSCPEELLNLLATFWESVEEIYTTNLKQVLYQIKVNLNSIAPFVQYVKDCMKRIMNRPNQQAVVLTKFRLAFNTFGKDTRTCEKFKTEMYCRIEDFKEKLAEMTDIEMMESENTRRAIISANWASDRLKEIVNDYVTILQIELLRFIESIYFINDYYTGILSGLPMNEDMYKEEVIPKFKDIGADYINKMFRDTAKTIDMVHFEKLFLDVIEKLQISIKQMNENVSNCIEATKTGKSNSKLTKNIENPIQYDLLITNKESDKLIKEWQMAAKGETLRMNLQIELVKSTALKSIEQFLKPIQKIYHEVFNEIYSKYFNEMENITQIYHIFNAAVAKEAALKKELIFETDFNVYSKIISDLLPQEMAENEGFTVEQLSKLSDIFLNLRPSGYITKENFIFILQDVITDANIWNKLVGVSQLKKVVDALFDNLPYVYWKDFIIYNLKIPFPSEREFLITRKALRECDPYSTELIQDYQFFSTKLWFEYVFLEQDSLRNRDIKKLLYRLYYIKNYGLNYTAMLLDFCKDSNAVEGFAKALALSLGKMVCWDIEIGNNFKENYFIRKQEHEQEVRKRNGELEYLYEEVYGEVGNFVGKIVNDLKGVVIEDFNSGDEEKVKRESSNKNVIISNEAQLDNVRTDSTGSTGLIYFLPIEIVETVLSSSVPWHLRVEDITDLSLCEKAAEIYEKYRNPDFNMSVFSHEYLNSQMFRDLLSSTKKFRAIDPIRVMNDVLNEN